MASHTWKVNKRDFSWLCLHLQYYSLQLTREPHNLNSNHPSSLTTSNPLPYALRLEPCTYYIEFPMEYHLKLSPTSSWQEVFFLLGAKIFITKSWILNLDTFEKVWDQTFPAHNPLSLYRANLIFCDFCLPCGMRSLFLWGAFLFTQLNLFCTYLTGAAQSILKPCKWDLLNRICRWGNGRFGPFHSNSTPTTFCRENGSGPAQPS